MCEPISASTLAIAALGTSVAGTTASFIGQTQQASSQNKYQNARYASTAEQALSSLRDQIGLGNQQVSQEAAASARSSLGNAREGAQMQGVAAVRSAAGNVSGVTADELVSNFARLEAENENILQTNMAWSREQMGQQFRGMRANAQSRISSVAPNPVAGPSPFALLTNLAGSYLNYQAARPATVNLETLS